MELVYAARAIRRYWWVSALAVLFAVAGALLLVDRGSVYESEAMVLVVPVAESAFGGTSTDRYVQNQLVVLQSAQLAREVAAVTGVDDIEEIRNSVSFEQLPGTDIVSVRVESDSASQAQAIANGYVESYLTVLQAGVQEARSPEVDRLNQEIEETAALLDDVNQRVQETMAPFIASANGQVVPSIDQVDPGLATERDVVRSRYLDLLESRDAVADELISIQTGGQFVQEAGLPEAGVGRSGLLLLAGAFAGMVLGGLGAVALARTSPQVLDVDEVVERLDRPVVATIPAARAIRDDDWLLTGEYPSPMRTVVNELCVRAESSVEPGGTLTVVVAGAQRSAGATTVATAMATHFARASDVVLVDASLADPELSRRAGADARAVVDFVEQSRSGSKARPSLSPRTTSLASLMFAGLGGDTTLQLRRREVAQLVQAATDSAQVVVVDAGPLMSTASSAHLAELADVVVLTVPVRQQRGAALDVVADQLRKVSGTVLTVATPLRRSPIFDTSARDRSRPRPVQDADADSRDGSGLDGPDPRVPVRPPR